MGGCHASIAAGWSAREYDRFAAQGACRCRQAYLRQQQGTVGFGSGRRPERQLYEVQVTQSSGIAESALASGRSRASGPPRMA